MVLAGEKSLLQSAAWMKKAMINLTCDSSPLHIASAMNAPVLGLYCSTTKSFGFTPLSDVSEVMEVEENLPCKPCGLHGKKSCPEGHFKCSNFNTGLIIKKIGEMMDRNL